VWIVASIRFNRGKLMFELNVTMRDHGSLGRRWGGRRRRLPGEHG
jgi:hypothetical protein